MHSLKIAVIMVLAFNALYSLYNWTKEPDPLDQGFGVEQVLTPPPQVAEGLDLKALASLTKEVRSGQELERRLNEAESINNLDLNADQKVDYIYVKEYGEPTQKLIYSLTTQPAKSEVQEIASITVEKNEATAEIQVTGNEQIYGDNAIYNDHAPLQRQTESKVKNSEGMQHYNSYFMPRPLWISPWYYGFYPPMFGFYPIVSRSMYHTRVSRYPVSSVSRGSNRYQQQSKTKIANPDRGKTASRGITRSLRKPTATQKQFQKTKSRNIRSGGFGRSGSKSLTSSKSATGFGQNSNRSSRLSQRRGGSFGSQSRSYRSSFRSSYGRSRSFSFGGK